LNASRIVAKRHHAGQGPNEAVLRLLQCSSENMAWLPTVAVTSRLPVTVQINGEFRARRATAENSHDSFLVMTSSMSPRSQIRTQLMINLNHNCVSKCQKTLI
jgi:hypothetical protein